MTPLAFTPFEQLPEACRRVATAARAAGLEIGIHVLDQSSRTAEKAAEACGTTVGQIVKSLVFAQEQGTRPVLLLVSGANRVKESLVGEVLGETIVRPDADFVRNATGFAIGGIPPLGHAEPLATYIDEDLLAHGIVWAAAGTPNSVFAVDPKALMLACGATAIAVTD
ncbi:MAG: YbaK/EbsC family protein [Pseudomonadota bacterium]|nr:YbaK/EbsC family protein [Pseudomonadota bacterium]